VSIPLNYVGSADVGKCKALCKAGKEEGMKMEMKAGNQKENCLESWPQIFVIMWVS